MRSDRSPVFTHIQKTYFCRYVPSNYSNSHISLVHLNSHSIGTLGSCVWIIHFSNQRLQRLYKLKHMLGVEIFVRKFVCKFVEYFGRICSYMFVPLLCSLATPRAFCFAKKRVASCRELDTNRFFVGRYNARDLECLFFNEYEKSSKVSVSIETQKKHHFFSSLMKFYSLENRINKQAAHCSIKKYLIVLYDGYLRQNSNLFSHR